MNKNLRNHVTNRSFVLSLSKGQANALIYVANKNRDLLAEDSWAMSHLSRLKDKGLVQHDSTLSLEQYQQGQPAWTLTRAGELTYELLKEAGMAKDWKL